MKTDTSRLDDIVAKRPSSKINKRKQNLYLDKGYDFREIENNIIEKKYLSPNSHRREQAIINTNILLEDGQSKELDPGTTDSETFGRNEKR